MEGFYLAKDGEWAGATGLAGADQHESGTGAPSRAPSQGSRLFFSPPRSDPQSSIERNADWLRDHEAVGAWLRSISPADRPAFLARIAANIESIEASLRSNLEPSGQDAVLSYAVLIEYASHLGVSPTEVCWILANDAAEPADPLLGVRVDRMLEDGAERRKAPRRDEDDGQWKSAGRRAGMERRVETRVSWTNRDSRAFHAGAPGRAG